MHATAGPTRSASGPRRHRLRTPSNVLFVIAGAMMIYLAALGLTVL